MLRILPKLVLISLFIGGCVPLNMHGALREAYDKLEAENQAVKKELAQASTESKRLQQEAAALKASNDALTRQAKDLAANLQQLNREKSSLAEQAASAQAALASREAEKTALAVKAEEQAIALQRKETVKARPPAAEPEKEKPPQALEAALRDERANGYGAIRREGGSVIIELLEPALFYNSASATIRPEGLKVLKRIADVLKDGTEKEIKVESHTDVVIRTTRFPSNMDLSVARANGVLRFLKTQRVAGATRMSAAGFAEPQVVATGDSAQARARNKRVEIIILSR